MAVPIVNYYQLFQNLTSTNTLTGRLASERAGQNPHGEWLLRAVLRQLGINLNQDVNYGAAIALSQRAEWQRKGMDPAVEGPVDDWLQQLGKPKISAFR